LHVLFFYVLVVPIKTNVIDYWLKYIFKYPKTEKELILQLRKKKYSEDEIEKCLNYLKKKGYLNDAKFANDYIDFHCIRRWKPLIWVKQKLFEKWVSKIIISNIIDNKINEINKWIKEKIKKDIEQYKNRWFDWLKILEKLSNKWYTYKQIKNALYEND